MLAASRVSHGVVWKQESEVIGETGTVGDGDIRTKEPKTIMYDLIAIHCLRRRPTLPKVAFRRLVGMRYHAC